VPPSTSRPAWLIIACGALIICIAMGVRATAALFMQPMTLANGWSREAFSLAFAVQNLVWGLANPLFGLVADRYGAGRVLVGGALLYVLGLALMAVSGSPAALLGSSGLLIGLGLSGTSFGVVLGVVARTVPPEKRSAAMGLTAAGASVGQFVMLPLGQGLIGAFEWQGALIALALITALMVPLAAALTGRAEQGSTVYQSIGAALREAGQHRTFHYLFWSYFTCGFHTAFIALHLPSYLVDLGLPIRVGVTALALIGLFNIFGSYGSGVLGGRHSKKGLLTWLYLARAVVILAFVLAPKTPAVVYLFAAAMGLLWLGTVPLTNGLVAQIYGTRYVSMLSGIVFLGHQLGSFLGAWLGGYIFDASGSYDTVWWLAILLGVSAAALSWPVDERPLVRPVPV
jgi:predicted MFS family arabinose efflux permease